LGIRTAQNTSTGIRFFPMIMRGEVRLAGFGFMGASEDLAGPRRPAAHLGRQRCSSPRLDALSRAMQKNVQVAMRPDGAIAVRRAVVHGPPSAFGQRAGPSAARQRPRRDRMRIQV
jgi:hypothetical protein